MAALFVYNMDDDVNNATSEVETFRINAQVEDVTEQIIDREPGTAWEPICFAAVENLCVYDENGYRIRMGDVYMKQKTILIFVRHFLCFICKDYVADLARVQERYLKEAGVQLVVIGHAPHKYIKPFRELTGLHHLLYCDPERKVYHELQLRSAELVQKKSPHVRSSTVLGILNSTWRAMQCMEWQGNIDQQGGAFVVGPGNNVHYAHIDYGATDHAPINEVLMAADVKTMDFTRAQVIHI
ncbi:PREDICTED: thioredoxin-like protein AAED1 [Priapulus caudatus]|uniref:Thioredoxin-like protein AAED1 n=1 Tax=Priapulus caudatus TaxID=37621 RepID=A0ABM1DUI3_PRICU|nr:PREDICTED: thioredoxin-like protein AAED1 [Priapulus caudatus]